MRWKWVCCLLLAAGCVTQPPDITDPDDDGNPDGDSLAVLPDPPAYQVDDALIPSPALAGRPLLNEVRHAAAEGAAAFVELKSVTAADLAAGLQLINERDETLAISPAVAPQDAHGIIVVHFDGQSVVQGEGIHSDQTSFLNAETGFVVLADADARELDRVSWGPQRAEAVTDKGTGAGGPTVGAVLVRSPQSILPSAGDDWFASGPLLATPGRPNRNLAVNMLFPLDGALVLADELRVDWAFVPGPSEYRVQVSSESNFAAPVVDQAVADGPLPLALPPGGYYWRVQAAYPDGSLADWSPVARFVVVTDQIEGEPPDDATTSKSIVLLQGIPQPTELSRFVPMYFQHKDTHLLQLESDQPSGTSHAWDAPHATLNKSDPADNTNCARAATSMVNGFFAHADDSRPNLSQDRIGLHIFTEVNDLGHPGPEFDLGYGHGLHDSEYAQALEFALGAAPATHGISGEHLLAETFLGIYPPDLREQFWKDLGTSIAADKPVPLTIWTGPRGTGEHAVVATGRFVFLGVRFVRLNDPWDGRRRVPLDHLRIRVYWILPDNPAPRADEEAIRSLTDADEDGVIDFDELIRFGTNLHQKDSDLDCVDDLAEIRGSVFNPRHGWGIHQAAAYKKLPRASDGASRQNQRPEIESDTADTDGGGLNDPMEDLNLNGRVEAELGETDPNDPADDARTITGFYRTVTDEFEDDDGFVTHTVQEVRTDYDLHTSGGKITGTVKVHHTFRNTRDFQSFDEDCPGPRHDETTWEINFDTPAEAQFICQGLRVSSTEPRAPQAEVPATFTDSCDGTFPTVFRGPVNSWGVTNIAGDFIVEAGGRVIYRQELEPIAPGSDTSWEWEIVVQR